MRRSEFMEVFIKDFLKRRTFEWKRAIHQDIPRVPIRCQMEQIL